MIKDFSFYKICESFGCKHNAGYTIVYIEYSIWNLASPFSRFQISKPKKISKRLLKISKELRTLSKRNLAVNPNMLLNLLESSI